MLVILFCLSFYCVRVAFKTFTKTDMYDKRAEHGRDFFYWKSCIYSVKERPILHVIFWSLIFWVIFQNITKRNENHFYFGTHRTSIIRLFLCYCCLRMRIFFLLFDLSHTLGASIYLYLIVLAGSSTSWTLE